jgi:hypothetical protein
MSKHVILGDTGKELLDKLELLVGMHERAMNDRQWFSDDKDTFLRAKILVMKLRVENPR